MDALIRDLKNKLKTLHDKTESEENLKIHVTSWILQELGYNADDFDYEHSFCRRGKEKHADIYIPVKNGGLFVETKKYTKNLDVEDVRQLIEYLNMQSVTWGILTNGRQYYLLNNAIKNRNSYNPDNPVLSKVVLYVEIGQGKTKGKNEKYLTYFAYDNIFVKQTTNFYRDIAQFLTLHPLSESSKGRYTNTLYNFFDYCAKKGNRYITTTLDSTLALEEITEKDAIDFLKAERKFGRPYKGGIPKAKCAHITTMFEVLQKAKYIRENKMKNLLERAKIEFNAELEKRSVKDILTQENIYIIMKWLEEEQKPSRQVVFILCAYYGFDKSAIIDFCSSDWNIIDFNKHYFEFKGRRFPLVPKLENALLWMRQDYVQRKIKPKAIYVKKHNGKYSPITQHTINALFEDGIQKLNVGKTDWSVFTTQTIRASLIIKMYEAGCSLEEISYLTGAPISGILQSEGITEEMIKKCGEKSWNNGMKSGKSKHPFNEYFNK